MDRVFVAQSAASQGASSAEQFYVSVSRARDSVTVYTDDKARLAENIQSSGARVTAHELLKLPAATNSTDPFESKLREKAAMPVEPVFPNLKVKECPAAKNQPTASSEEAQELKPLYHSETERPKHGIFLQVQE